MIWPQRLQRVFNIETEVYRHCQGPEDHCLHRGPSGACEDTGTSQAQSSTEPN